MGKGKKGGKFEEGIGRGMKWESLKKGWGEEGCRRDLSGFEGRGRKWEGKFEEGMGEGCGRESLRMGWGGEVGEFKRDWGEERSRIVYRVVGEWKEEGKFKERMGREGVEEG